MLTKLFTKICIILIYHKFLTQFCLFGFVHNQPNLLCGRIQLLIKPNTSLQLLISLNKNITIRFADNQLRRTKIFFDVWFFSCGKNNQKLCVCVCNMLQNFRRCGELLFIVLAIKLKTLCYKTEFENRFLLSFLQQTLQLNFINLVTIVSKCH